MNWDPAALTVTGLIATFLSLVFAVAAHASTSKRAKERQSLRRMLDAREQSSVPPAALPADAAADPAVVTAPPIQSPPRARPVATASNPAAPAIPPAVSEPPRRPPNAPITMFKRYTTQPQTPPGEPAASGGPSKPPDESEPLWD